ncbi:baseplate wedge subunit [Synechococcus phage S-CAM7]|uniref:Baseplate wedge protein n=1 Tax=Synechococcus phage S-CAM7 TaxID=1883368 RepID=A0A1D8KTT0_9CAUD|nr:baseplate wedge subunit [Synechococcus phage S-CAM7]AOV62051.1 baseplate wedge subunit [Synechococcus phage S-CAM7]QLF86177.1 baseplate wedge protein [Synechococcus phage S-CAM7]
MAFTKFTNLDYDQIRESIKDYLRANSNFSGFDFDGSNFSILIDTLAYNAYINSVNANMIVNESFLDSATLRRNVVSLAGNIGYLPRSRKAARARVKFTVQTSSTTPTLTLKAGLVAVGSEANSSYVFSIPEDITTTVVNGVAQFGTDDEPIEIYQGTFAKTSFNVDTSLDQRFIIANPDLDYSTLVVRIKDPNEVGLGKVWERVENIIKIDSNSEIYFLAEVNQENYELLFGDDIFGKALQNGQVIDSTYIVTKGKEGDGPANFTFSGSLVNDNGAITAPSNVITVDTLESARNGADIETVDSIKYYAPRVYGAQYRAVTGRDYEGIIKSIYPNTESVSVVGGEELVPPQFGNVLISIKPVNGLDVSDFDKKQILDGLKQYTIAGINQKIVDLKILFVELDASVYYDVTKVGNSNTLKTDIMRSLNSYSTSIDINKFGGRFKYSKVQKVIDDTDIAVTSNITKVIVRRNLNAVLNQFAQYELCYGNAFHPIASGGSIKSSGFTIAGSPSTLYITDAPNKDNNGNLDGSGMGTISFISENINSTGSSNYITVVEDAGFVDYAKGEIQLFTTNITGTSLPNEIIEIQAYPNSNDVIGLKDLYVVFDVSTSRINMVKDTISSGEQISGVGFPVTSSYGNGKLTR